MEDRKTTELSDREKQIVDLASEGHTDTSIAHELGISEATVSTYWSRVRMKIGPYSRPELVARIIRSNCSQIVKELRDQNKQLIGQIEKDTGIEWGEDERNFYRELLEQAPDAILVVNDRGEIESSNQEAARLFGFDQEKMSGMPLQELIPERFRFIHDQHRKEYMTNPERRRMAEHSVSLARHSSGKEFPIAASLSPVTTVTGTHVMCILREAPRAAYLQSIEQTQVEMG